jgi:glycerophosphoryl diester phosphodiesterase
MFLLAHRGYHADAPENTMAAFEAASKIGVDGIETDVRLSADGKAVIIHDRISPKKRAVAELSHRDLESDCGHAVPLLAEILDAFPHVLWNIEIKNAEAWPAARPVLQQFQRTHRLLVTSFRHDVVRQCADELGIECGVLLAHRPLDVMVIIAGCAERPRIKSIVWDYNIVDDSVLRAVSAAGWANYVYGAVTSAEHRRCMALGLTGLITDYPRLVAGGCA